METKEKQRLMIGIDYNFLSSEGSQLRFLDVQLEAARVRAGSGNLIDFPGLQFECLVIFQSDLPLFF